MKIARRGFLKLGGLSALLAAMPRALAEALGYPRALQGPMIGAPGP
jgi:alkaline phosphatase D